MTETQPLTVAHVHAGHSAVLSAVTEVLGDDGGQQLYQDAERVARLGLGELAQRLILTADLLHPAPEGTPNLNREAAVAALPGAGKGLE